MPDPLVVPDVPTPPDLTPDFPDLPSDFVLGDIRLPVFSDAPEFTLAAPVVSYPPPPGDIDATAPDNPPTIDIDSIVYPDDPIYTLSTVPTLESLTIPTAPVTNIPTFSATEPDDTDLVIPGLTFAYTEDEYDSALLQAVTAELIDRIQNGGTGLPVTVETAIWNRARDREEQTSKKTKQELVDDYAKRGFSLPPGVLFAKLQEASQAAQNQIATLSRDIAIKQAELEQSNIQHAIENSIRLESTLINYKNAKAQRAFDAARLAQEFAIGLFDVAVKKLNAQVQIYNAAATIYEAQIRGELAKVEIFRSEIEAQKLINDINESNVRVYTAQLQGIQVQADVFKTQMDAVRTRLEGEKTRLDTYRAQIENYIAQVQAKKNEYDIFSSQINAELSKVQVYEAQVSAFSERIKAYASTVDAQSKITDADIASENARLEAYKAKLSAAISRTDVEAKRVDALVQIFNSDVQAYSALLTAEQTRYQTDSDITRLNIDLVKAETELAVLQNKLQFEKVLAQLQLHLSIVETEGQVSSQLLAAALSAVNLSAGISSSDSFNISHSHTYQEK